MGGQEVGVWVCVTDGGDCEKQDRKDLGGMIHVLCSPILRSTYISQLRELSKAHLNLLFLIIFTEIWLIYNVLISAVQRSDSYSHRVSFIVFSVTNYHRILNTAPCTIQ